MGAYKRKPIPSLQLMTLLQPHESSTATSPSANQIQSTLHFSISSNMSSIPLCLSTCTHNLCKPRNIPWIIDTGATNHMTCSTSCFTNINASISYSLKLPNGHNVPVTHTGTIQLTKSILLADVLCVPSFSFNLLSTKKLSISLTYCLFFFSDYCFIQDLVSWTTIGKGEVRNDLYHLQLPTNVSSTALAETVAVFPQQNAFITTSVINTMNVYDLWHCRLGHVLFPRLGLISDPICPMANHHRLPFPISHHKSSHIFEMIHCDIWGPYSTTAYDGSKYFLTIIDDFSRSTWLYLLKNKSESRKCIESFIIWWSHYLVLKLKFYEVIMVLNFTRENFLIPKASFIIKVVLKHLSKMA